MGRAVVGRSTRTPAGADGRATPYEGDMDEYKRLVLSATAEPSNGQARETKSVSKAELRREAADRQIGRAHV